MSSTSDKLGGLYDQHGEKLRFLVVGACNTGIGYLLFLGLLAVLGPSIHALADSSVRLLALAGRNYFLVVQWIGWVIAVPISTTTMKYFAFRSKGRWLHQVGRAYFVYLPAQGLSTVILWVIVRVARLLGIPDGISVPLGQLVTIAVATVFSYLGHKYFTFRVPLEVGEVPAEELLD